MLKILLFSDVHGSIEAMELLHRQLANVQAEYDCAIFAGDISNFFFEGRETLPTIPLLFAQFEALDVPVYFVRGNRDVNLQLRASIPFDFANGIFLEGRATELPNGTRVTGDHERLDLDNRTILVTHFEEVPLSQPGLHIVGHTHVARYSPSFINLGFLYRTEEHGAKSMNGIFWLIELDGARVANLRWYALEGKNEEDQSRRQYPFKEYHCHHHPDAGTWVLPFYWKRCPLCYKK
ncbi:MAG TPA: metallophosphoesterase family protein [Candidatus Lokiarchaeia archaeon]|nr:metallophosphoesterase family protein [Candidatus Lokiarchaeia archaeon]